jgi:membrane protease YdiL (CAAX protease family)
LSSISPLLPIHHQAERLADRLLNLRRIRPFYAILAIVMPFAVICLSIFLSQWFGESRDQFGLAGGSNLLPMILLAVLAPIMEEIGWHGYGVDSLRASNGMMRTTLLFAVLWCTWHVPLALIPGTYRNAVFEMENKIFIANFFVSIIPVAIIANWAYYTRTTARFAPPCCCTRCSMRLPYC